MEASLIRRAVGGTAALVTCLVLGGCFSAHTNITVSPRDHVAGCGTVEQVRPGKTTVQWLTAALGEPTSKGPSANGGEIYKYEYTETSNSHAQFWPLPRAQETIKTRHQVCFEVREGVIQRHWREAVVLEKNSSIH